MRLNLIQSPFWNLPSVVDDDNDNWLTNWSNSSGWSLSEDDKNFYVTVSVPGVEEKDIDVTFNKGVLWVKGETIETEEDKKRKFYRRSDNSFSYRIAVPGEIDMAKEPDATYKNGVMTVKFAKIPAVQPKKITVKTSK